MKCNKCGAFWKLGNLEPIFERCPMCNEDFSNNNENLKFDSITEVLQYLILKNGIEYWQEEKRILGYLNDCFPDNHAARDQIESLFAKGFSEKLIDWCARQPNEDEVSKALDEADFVGDKDVYVEKILYLSGTHKESGTNTRNAKFYLDYARVCGSLQYKMDALKKAIELGAGEDAEFQYANMLLKEDRDRGISFLKKMVEQGNINAILTYSKIYEQGKLVEMNNKISFETLKAAEEYDNGDIYYQLGRLYLLGRGVPSNKRTAIEYFEKASLKGNSKADYQLFVIYFDSEKELKKKAVEKLKNAFDAEYEPAMYEYALLLLDGKYLPENIPMALTILESCANSGNQDAIAKLYYMFQSGYKVNKDKFKASEWKEKFRRGK